MFTAAMFCSVSGLLVPFPSRLILDPFAQWFAREAQSVASRRDDTFLVGTAGKLLHDTFDMGDIRWMHRKQPYKLCRDNGASWDGLFSWGYSPVKEQFQSLPLLLRRAILPTAKDETDHEIRSPWSSDETLKPLSAGSNRCGIDPVLFDKVQSQEPAILEKTASNTRSQLRQPSPTVNTILMPQTFELLKDFRPMQWAKDLDYLTAAGIGGWWNPPNLLLVQIMILDITIRLIVRKGDEDRLDATDHVERKSNDNQPEEAEAERWGLPEVHLVMAITKGVEAESDEAKPADAQPLSVLQNRAPWDLDQALRLHSGLDFGCDTEEEQRKLRQLADLLKIRALFVIALLMLGPDSSDVYFARSGNVRMPMI